MPNPFKKPKEQISNISMAVSFVKVCLKSDADGLRIYRDILTDILKSAGQHAAKELSQAQSNLEAVGSFIALNDCAQNLYEAYESKRSGRLNDAVEKFAQAAEDALDSETRQTLLFSAFPKLTPLARARKVAEMFGCTVQGDFYALESLLDFLSVNHKAAVSSVSPQDSAFADRYARMIADTKSRMNINSQCGRMLEALMNADETALAARVQEAKSFVLEYLSDRKD